MSEPYTRENTEGSQTHRYAITSTLRIEEIINLLASPSEADRNMLTKAYAFAAEKHAEQKRFSGEPYFVHLYHTAKNLAELSMSAEVIAAGFLHDVLEDADVTPEALTKEFGTEITFLVEGVTKLGKLKYRGAERHAENLRKLFVAMAQDIRVLIIKLADRLHNVQTLEHVKPEKRQRIALETLQIYAPLANRLGMGNLKDALESGAFPYAYPAEYSITMELFEQKAPRAKENLEQVYTQIKEACEKQGLSDVRIDYRVKQIYSLYKKLALYDLDIDKIYDIIALRIIVPSVSDCYQILGLIHGLWKPVPGRIKDYIALPKPNGYQSIHTSVFTEGGAIAEFQIRTEDMNREAEYGIVSHIAYTEAGKPKTGGIISKKLAWVKQLLEWQKNFSESQELMESLKTDFFQKRIFAFTPKGDVIELPESATPVDFAYAIHSDIGNHTAGAKVNGKLVTLDSPLKNGDIIEIMTSKNAKPSSKWLEFVQTALARQHIRAETHTQAVTNKRVKPPRDKKRR